MLALGLALERGHGLRVATVCAASGAMLAASAGQWWAHGRRRTPRYALVLTSCFVLLAVVLLARAAQALLAAPTAKVATDAPSPVSLATLILVLVMGGLMNLAQILLVLSRVLQQVALTLRETLRSGDVVARWGGEEFCVLLSRVNEAEAHALAVRMAARIASSSEPRVTVSVGVAQAHPATEGSDDVLRRADAAPMQRSTAPRRPGATVWKLRPCRAGHRLLPPDHGPLGLARAR